ncbi:MAG: gamma-glutamyltransferase [Planctomycetes bacterium]|nr:gamma-glutamyltransferase [Planctomycetota bacterium]
MRFLPLLCFVAILVSVAGAPAAAQVAARPVTGGHGVVASPEPYAAQVGIDIMRQGGNAVDAAVAMGFALAVTLPSAGNLGGGGFMVIHLPDGRDVAVDYREMAPLAATRDMYLDAAGKAVSSRSRMGHLAAGVPGSPAGLCHVQAKYGKLSLEEVMAPAIALAKDGIVVSRFLAGSLRGSALRLGAFAESKRIFLADGGLWKTGETFKQPDLARTLERIAKSGRDGFYKGPVADAIVAEMTRGKGLMTHADLAGYEVKERAPTVGTYRGCKVVSMPPPSSGGTALVQMLNLLEAYPIRRWGPGSERTLHFMVESMRLAFRDRARHMGDADFTPVPAAGMASKAYAAKLRDRIREVAGVSEAMPPAYPEKEQTTHYSTMDASGCAVACTTTLNGGYGCAVTVPGAGFLLNNEMDDFASAPGVPNMYGLIQGEANAVGPRRRPLSSMTPTLLQRDGRVIMVIGSPGGPTIINTVLQCVLNVVDHDMDIAQAIAAPRVHHQWLPDRIVHEPFGINPDVLRGLRKRGHDTRARRGWMGDAHGILWDAERKMMTAASDPRNGGRAMGF